MGASRIDTEPIPRILIAGGIAIVWLIIAFIIGGVGPSQPPRKTFFFFHALFANSRHRIHFSFHKSFNPIQQISSYFQSLLHHFIKFHQLRGRKFFPTTHSFLTRSVVGPKRNVVMDFDAFQCENGTHVHFSHANCSGFQPAAVRDCTNLQSVPKFLTALQTFSHRYNFFRGIGLHGWKSTRRS